MTVRPAESPCQSVAQSSKELYTAASIGDANSERLPDRVKTAEWAFSTISDFKPTKSARKPNIAELNVNDAQKN